MCPCVCRQKLSEIRLLEQAIETFKARKAAKYEQMCDEFTFLLKDSGAS